MITYKLPISLSTKNQQIIKTLQKQQSCIIRSAFSQEKSEKELRNYFKSFSNLSHLDSWFIQSGIRDGLAMKLADKELEVKTRVFGSKKLLEARSQNRVSKEEWKEARLLPLYICGEANKKGNRKFNFDKIIDSNLIEFKPNRGINLQIQLPKLKGEYKKFLYRLEMATNEQLIAVTIRLTTSYICITFDESLLADVSKYSSITTRILGIDMNPNWIGASIQEDGKVLDSKIYDLSKLTKKSGLPSSHIKSKQLNNKLDHETREIAKSCVSFARSQNVGLISIESLNFKQGNKGIGKYFNRITSNAWKRALFVRALKKQANAYAIQVKEVNAAYSSTIGNLLNRNYPDAIASSIEVGRRATGKFYPELILKTNLPNQWKEEAELWEYKDWKELHQLIKKSKLMYRVPIPNGVVFRKFCSNKSNASYLLV